MKYMPEKVYYVKMPITGIVSKYFKAESEKEAIQKAMDDFPVFSRVDTTNNWDLEELNVYEKLFAGNVDYTNLSEAVAEESDEFDPEDLE